MKQLKKIYYSAEGYQSGKSAAVKLKKKIPKLTAKQIQHWLDQQPVYQIYEKAT